MSIANLCQKIKDEVYNTQLGLICGYYSTKLG